MWKLIKIVDSIWDGDQKWYYIPYEGDFEIFSNPDTQEVCFWDGENLMRFPNAVVWGTRELERNLLKKIRGLYLYEIEIQDPDDESLGKIYVVENNLKGYGRLYWRKEDLPEIFKK